MQIKRPQGWETPGYQLIDRKITNSDKTPKCLKHFSGVFIGQIVIMEASQQLDDGCKQLCCQPLCTSAKLHWCLQKQEVIC